MMRHNNKNNVRMLLRAEHTRRDTYKQHAIFCSLSPTVRAMNTFSRYRTDEKYQIHQYGTCEDK